MTSPQSPEQICKAMLESIQMYGSAGDLTAADGFYSGICNACTRYPTESALRGVLAEGAAAMAFHHGRSGGLEEADGFINDLRALCSEYPAEEPQWNFLADALSTQSIHQGNREQWEAVEEIYRELRRVAGLFPNSVFIQEQFALAAFNHTVGLMSEGKVEEIFEIFNELRGLSVHVLTSTGIRASLGKVCFNLSTLSLEERFEETKLLCKELRLMVEAHPSEEELLVHATMATCNVSTKLAMRGHIDDAVRLYGVIAGWAERNPEVRVLQEQRVLAARNILVVRESRWNVQDAWKLFQDVAAAVATNPENATIRAWCAESARALWIKAAKLGERGQAEMVYLALAGLANRYPVDAHLREAVEAIRPIREQMMRSRPDN
jgi:hypothetical protein